MNTPLLIDTSIILLAYLLGSFSSAIAVCRIMALGDPRVGGSGNPGTTNVLRLYGKPAALLTLTGDVLKGMLPVLLARVMNTDDIIIALTGFAAFTGHVWPVFFRFRGGKGVATLIGVLAATHWMLGLAFVGTWLVTALLFRYASLAGLLAAIMTPVYVSQVLADQAYLYLISMMCVILIWRHHNNTKKLLSGKEDKIGQADK